MKIIIHQEQWRALLTTVTTSYLRRRRLCCQSRCRSVCLFVWLSVKKVRTYFDEISWGVRHGPGTNNVKFGDDADHRLDPGVRSPKTAFTGLSKKLPTDFNEILWRARMWPRDQLSTFWYRSANSTPFTAKIHYLQFQRPLQKLYARYHPCVAARRLEMFREPAPTLLRLIRWILGPIFNFHD